MGTFVTMADPIHPCCDPSSRSSIWTGSSNGTVINIDGIETYVAKPWLRKTGNESERSSSRPKLYPGNLKRVILFLTEAHGIYLPNAQILADSFAIELNCDVLMPDQFAGQPRIPKTSEPEAGKAEIPHTPSAEDNNTHHELGGIPISLKENLETADVYPFVPPSWWNEEDWKERHEPKTTDPLLTQVVHYIRKEYGREVKIGGVGYCFGGRYVMRLMGSGVMNVGVVNHPSFYTLEEVQGLKSGMKLAVYAAAVDEYLPTDKRRDTEDILTRQGCAWTSTVFSGVEHGFAVRGDLSITEVRMAKDGAFQGAVQWFNAWL
jgi:dienelactone hydrolase